MKPNTLVLGFYDSSYPEDYFLQDPRFCRGAVDGAGFIGDEGDNFGVDLPSLQAHFPPVRHAESPRWLQPDEYVGIISDAIKMGKNVCLGRYFFQLPPESKGKSTTSTKSGDPAAEMIDVWPSNLLSVGGNQSYADVCSLFLLQMACVLNMAAGWRRARLRIFLCVESESGDQGWLAKEERFRELLGKLRIRASIKIVPWDSVVRLLSGGDRVMPPVVTEEFLCAVNRLLKEHSTSAAVRFLYLPCPPADSSQSQQYLAQLDTLTQGLGPTLLIHGVTPVTCTEL